MKKSLDEVERRYFSIYQLAREFELSWEAVSDRIKYLEIKAFKNRKGGRAWSIYIDEVVKLRAYHYFRKTCMMTPTGAKYQLLTLNQNEIEFYGTTAYTTKGPVIMGVEGIRFGATNPEENRASCNSEDKHTGDESPSVSGSSSLGSVPGDSGERTKPLEEGS